MNTARQAVLIDMAYELGGQGLAQFHHLLDAIRVGNWEEAAKQLENSLLYRQVPVREQSNLVILRTGELPKGIIGAAGLVMAHEGCVLTAIPDAKGKWSIGYGHDIPAPQGPPPTCSAKQAAEWFAEDFAAAAQHAQDALGTDYW